MHMYLKAFSVRCCGAILCTFSMKILLAVSGSMSGSSDTSYMHTHQTLNPHQHTSFTYAPLQTTCSRPLCPRGRRVSLPDSPTPTQGQTQGVHTAVLSTIHTLLVFTQWVIVVLVISECSRIMPLNHLCHYTTQLVPSRPAGAPATADRPSKQT